MKKNSLLLRLFLCLMLPLFLFQCAAKKPSNIPALSERVLSHNLSIDDSVYPDPELSRFISVYRDSLAATMGQVVGQAAVGLSKDRPEGTLNNFVADLMLKRANAEFDQPVHAALTNRGGLRVDIPKGPITLGKIYELMPFENELVVLKMTGAQMLKLGQQIGEAGGECIAGMTLTYKDKKLASMTVQGQPVESDSIYYLATSDFLSSAGRKRLSILGQVERRFVGVTLRNSILDEVKALTAAGKDVTAKLDGRIKFEKLREKKGAR